MLEGGRHLAEGTVGVGQVALDPGYIEKLSCLPGKPQSFFEAGDAAFRMVFESLDESQSEVKWYKIPRGRFFTVELEAFLEVFPRLGKIPLVKKESGEAVAGLCQRAGVFPHDGEAAVKILLRLVQLSLAMQCPGDTVPEPGPVAVRAASGAPLCLLEAVERALQLPAAEVQAAELAENVLSVVFGGESQSLFVGLAAQLVGIIFRSAAGGIEVVVEGVLSSSC